MANCDYHLQYPEWLEKNKDSTPPADLEKYRKQYDYVKQIVAKYDDPNFDEKDEKQAGEVVDLMQKVDDIRHHCLHTRLIQMLIIL